MSSQVKRCECGAVEIRSGNAALGPDLKFHSILRCGENEQSGEDRVAIIRFNPPTENNDDDP